LSSLEEKCQALLDKDNTQRWREFHFWKPNNQIDVESIYPLVGAIHRLSESAPEEECFFSPSKYIRWYRKRYNESK